MLYPYVMLEGDEEGDQTPVKPWDSKADLIPPLCSDTLSWSSLWKWHPGRMIPLTDFSYPVRLHRDPVTFV